LLAWAEAIVDHALSLRADAWTGDRSLTDRHGIGTVSLWGHARVDADGWGRIVGDGWLRAQSADDGSRRGLVRELYWRNTWGPVDMALGRQRVIWGRADGLNPTDNLAPRDLTLLAPDDGDLRHGNDGATATVTLPVSTVSLSWFPRIHGNTIPLQPIPGVRYVQFAPEAGQWAVRWEHAGHGNIDASVSYVSGLDPMPDLMFGGLSPAGLDVHLRNQGLRVLGADLSMVRNGVIWRAEIATTRTDSQGPADFTHKKPQTWFVGGGEWRLAEDTTLGLEATLLHVKDFGNPDDTLAGPLRDLAWRQLAISGQTAPTLAGVVWRVARRLRNDTVALEANGASMWPMGGGGSGSSVWRLRADVALDDHWHLLFGGDLYLGPTYSLFGQLRDNSLAYVQVRRGF
jgi:hypothetical protein